MLEKNQIVRIYGTEFKEMTKKLLEDIDAAAMIPSRHTLIGIKPNLVSPSTADYGATTHPEIIAGIIEYLQDKGFDNLMMLEGSWVGSRTSDCYTLCGYRYLSEHYKVPFYDLQKEKASRVDCHGMKIDICLLAQKTQFLINVPVLKGHCQTRITCALKNMKGLITNSEKRHFHSMGLHKPIAYLNTGIHQDLIIIDNICGDPDFEDGGNPVVRNCIMAALDPVLTDAYACKVLHRELSEVPYIRLAESLGVGSADLSKADIRTIGREDANADEIPFTDKVISLKDSVEEVDSCSACYGCLIPALQMLKDEGLLDKLNEKVCIGQGYRGKSGELGVGNCTRRFKTCIKGCPPTENEIADGLRKYIMDKG